MRGALVTLVIVAGGCDVGLETTALRVEPEALDVVVELGAAAPVPFHVLARGVDVTADASFALTGAPLGVVDPAGFTSDGRTGGRATIAVTYDGTTVTLPLHVVLHEARGDGEAPALFSGAAPTTVDASLEPGDGALLPPNLGRLDVEFAAPVGDDVHEVAVSGPDLDLHIYGRSAEAAREQSLTPAEWDAITRTSRGSNLDLIVRTLSSSSPGTAHVASAHLTIADLPFAAEVLFTGRHPTDPVSQVWSYQLARGTTEPWANGPQGTCLGCHLAISRDGRRFAAGGTYTAPAGVAFGGGIVDVGSRTFMAPPSAQIGVWQAAAFGADGELVTANEGVLTVRDGTTALPTATLATELPATQPAVGARYLAYVAGPLQTDRPLPINQELRIHDWPPTSPSLGPARVLVPKTDGLFVKLPDLSPDDRWVMFSRVTDSFRVMGDIQIIASEGGVPQTLARGFDMARFASSLEAARVGGADTEPMVWIVMKSDRPVGARPQTGIPLLWAMAFFPERGIASRPFYLPGQSRDILVAHAPSPLIHP